MLKSISDQLLQNLWPSFTGSEAEKNWKHYFWSLILPLSFCPRPYNQLVVFTVQFLRSH